MLLRSTKKNIINELPISRFFHLVISVCCGLSITQVAESERAD